MDVFDDEFEEPQPTKARRRSSGALWNILTAITLLGIVCVVVTFVAIYLNPQSGLNPFPPPTLPARLELPTGTATSVVNLPPTWTPTVTPEPSATSTPRPSATLPPTPTFFTLSTATATMTVTESLTGYPYEVQTGSPVAIANIYYPELGCDWMGVGGQAVDMSGSPVTGLVIRLGGVLGGKIVPTMTSLTGVALNYGRAGYEFKLADEPISSRGTLWVQLLDQAGVPLSEEIYFDTYSECEKNLIIINFKQVRP
jgi:hypothetical protein